MVALERKKNLKELLARVGPYNSINSIDDEIHVYTPFNTLL